MEIKETVISRIYENKFREFFITLKIKPTDITLDEREACRAACGQGTLMKGQLEQFQPEGMAGEHTYVIPEKSNKEETIYQKFKRTCIDYSGEDYYNRLKKHLGVEHLRDLEAKHSESMVEDLLKCQDIHITWRKLGYRYDEICNEETFLGFLTHKHNAYNLWIELFDSFNHTKT